MQGDSSLAIGSDVSFLAFYLDLSYGCERAREILRFPSLVPHLLVGDTRGASRQLEEDIRREFARQTSGKTLARNVHGFQILLNPQDVEISSYIATLGEYESITTALITMLVRSDRAVIDVGANIGWFTLVAASKLKGKGLVYSFEPEPTNFSLLNSSVARNHLPNVKLVKKCVSDTNQNRCLFYGRRDNPGSHSIVRDMGWGAIEVQSVTLDFFSVENHISRIGLLKIDVEGAEPNVMQGATGLIRQSLIDHIVLEWNPEAWDAHRSLLEELEDRFEFFWLAPRIPILRRIKRVSSLPKERTNLYLRRRGCHG
jgi:FkbM family methyltransferase